MSCVEPGQTWEAAHRDDPSLWVAYLTIERVSSPWVGWLCLELDTGSERVMRPLGAPLQALDRGMSWRRVA